MTLFTTATNIVLKIWQKTDVQNIAIYEQDKNEQIFTDIQFIDASVTDDKKLMEHPKEDGTLIVDHIIDDPKQITLQALISDNNTEALNVALDFYKKSTPVTIKVKNEILTNLVMSAKPFKADVSHYDKTVYNFTFKEIQVAQAQYVKMKVPKNKKNASKVKTGQKQSNNSALFDIRKKMGIAGKIKL